VQESSPRRTQCVHILVQAYPCGTPTNTQTKTHTNQQNVAETTPRHMKFVPTLNRKRMHATIFVSQIDAQYILLSTITHGLYSLLHLYKHIVVLANGARSLPRKEPRSLIRNVYLGHKKPRTTSFYLYTVTEKFCKKQLNSSGKKAAKKPRRMGMRCMQPWTFPGTSKFHPCIDKILGMHLLAQSLLWPGTIGPRQVQGTEQGL
jgi:hypothetical protein